MDAKMTTHATQFARVKIIKRKKKKEKKMISWTIQKEIENMIVTILFIFWLRTVVGARQAIVSLRPSRWSHYINTISVLLDFVFLPELLTWSTEHVGYRLRLLLAIRQFYIF